MKNAKVWLACGLPFKSDTFRELESRCTLAHCPLTNSTLVPERNCLTPSWEFVNLTPYERVRELEQLTYSS